MRSFLIFLFVLACFFEGACAFIPETASVAQEVTRPSVQLYPSDRDRKEADRIVYSELLSRIHNDTVFREKGVFDATGPTDLLVFKKETIEPPKVENGHILSEIPTSLLSKLTTGIGVKTELDGEYEVLAPVQMLGGRGSLQDLLFIAGKRHPETKGVVAFSRVAYDDNYDFALVYGEYVKSKNVEEHFYVVLKLEKYLPNKSSLEIIGVSQVKGFHVQ